MKANYLYLQRYLSNKAYSECGLDYCVGMYLCSQIMSKSNTAQMNLNPGVETTQNWQHQKLIVPQEFKYQSKYLCHCTLFLIRKKKSKFCFP